MTTRVVGVSTGGSSVMVGDGTSVNVGSALLVGVEITSAVVVLGEAGSVSDRVKVTRVVGEAVRESSSPPVGSEPGPGDTVTDTVVVCSTVWSTVCSTVCVMTLFGADLVTTDVDPPWVTVTWLVTTSVGFIVTVTWEGEGFEELGEEGAGAGELPEPPLRIFPADASSTHPTWTPVVVFIGKA